MRFPITGWFRKRKHNFTESGRRKASVPQPTPPAEDDGFLTSLVFGAVTNDALTGAVLGGDLTGALIGEALAPDPAPEPSPELDSFDSGRDSGSDSGGGGCGE